jgi:alkylated DNA repair protein alkB homolog 6
MASASSSAADLEPYKIGSLPSLYLIPEFITSTMEEHYVTNILATQSGWKHVSGRRLLNIGGVVSSKGSLLQAPTPNYIKSLLRELSEKYQLYNGESANHVLINSYTPRQGIMSHQDGPLYSPVVAILSLGSPAIIRFTKKRDDVDDDDDDDHIGEEGEDSLNLLSSTIGTSEKSGQLAMVSVVLPPRSLFIFKDDAYEQYLHGIDSVEEEILDDSVVNAEIRNQRSLGDQGAGENDAAAAAAAGKQVEIGAAGAPPVLRREGTRVSLTIRRVLKVSSLGLLRR